MGKNTERQKKYQKGLDYNVDGQYSGGHTKNRYRYQPGSQARYKHLETSKTDAYMLLKK